MQEEIENKTIIEKPSTAKQLGTGLVVSIVLISLLAGSAAGLLGGLYVSKNLNGSVGNKTQVAEDSAVIDVVNEASPAVVSIIISKDLNRFNSGNALNNPFFFNPFAVPNNNNTTPQYQETGAGSGFFITSDGLIVTNKHVVSDTSAKYTVMTQDGKSYDAKVLSVDPLNDLALVKVDINNAPTLKFADSAKIEIGQRVVAIGNSLGQYRNTVTTGIVSGIGRNITAGGDGISEQLEGVIQTDAAINPGNSGGPLLNIYGQVIGVNTAIDQQGQLVGFAIPANDVQKSVASYQRFGKIIKPFLGIRYVMITEAVKEQNKLPVDQGAWVTSGLEDDGSVSPAVVPGSAADKAGIKDGDIITKIDGKEINNDNSLAHIIKDYSPGDKLKVELIRDGKNISVDITLGESK